MELQFAITRCLLLVGLAAVVGVAGLFWLFRVGAAIAFLVAATGSLFIWPRRRVDGVG